MTFKYLTREVAHTKIIFTALNSKNIKFLKLNKKHVVAKNKRHLRSTTVNNNISIVIKEDCFEAQVKNYVVSLIVIVIST